jgi:hypothetical protein
MYIPTYYREFGTIYIHQCGGTSEGIRMKNSSNEEKFAHPCFGSAAFWLPKPVKDPQTFLAPPDLACPSPPHPCSLLLAEQPLH